MTAEKHNYALQARYQRQEGKGKGAPLSNEYGYKTCGYFGSPEQMFRNILRQEMRDYWQVQINESELKNAEEFERIFKGIDEHLNKLAKELADNFNEKVTIVVEGKKRVTSAIHKVLKDSDEGDDD